MGIGRADSHHAPTAPAMSQLVFWLCSFSSIGILLLHLPGWVPMHLGALTILLPCGVAMATIWRRAQRNGDRRLLERLYLGVLGGLWGTLAYDLFRIPLHLGGLNPFSPIYAYGMWLTAAPCSSPWSDAVGFLYHLSNGVTFGWIYSLLGTGRNWFWAVLWALALETLAVVTPFGTVFALRSYSGVVILAYVAHLFFGVPLGCACQYPRAALQRHQPFRARKLSWALLAGTALVGVWFVGATQPIVSRTVAPSGSIVISESGVGPGWSDLARGSDLVFDNHSQSPAAILYRPPSIGTPPGELFQIPPHGTREFVLSEPGVHQFAVAGRPWRSVFVAVRDGRDYRPKP